MVNGSYAAHGGNGLINRIVPEVERGNLKKRCCNKTYTISDADLSVFYRIADGVLSPLEGPMNSEEFNRVLDSEQIIRRNKIYAWTIPLAFPASDEESASFCAGETVAVQNSNGEFIGTLTVEDVYPFDKNKYNHVVYGTERTDHPGARIFNDDTRTMLIGGKIWALPQPKDPRFGKYMLSPLEVRALIQSRGWERAVAFQTRNALHRAHE
jgi:sulfate adenylyltransferase